MNLTRIHTSTGIRGVLLILCAAALAAGNGLAPVAAAQSAGEAAGAALIPPDQLDSLVAPIALYPDPLLAQVLAAATYPLEIIQLQQWLTKNPGLKDQALADALLKQPWDPSVQALAATPELVKRLADDIQWTTDLGNAFLAQRGRRDGRRAAHAQGGRGQECAEDAPSSRWCRPRSSKPRRWW